tara:strand:- start:147 stop:1190 length:1044 start_codon:yes stop_codon:yes gene_type:complete
MSELKTNKISTNDQNNVAIDNALGLKSYTTTQRDALTSAAGDVIYNTTTSKAEYYTGSAWVETGGPDVFEVDYVVVGGGGGGSGSFRGGGGAGGVISSVDQTGGTDNTPQDSIFLQASTNYAVSIGGGGTGLSLGTVSYFGYVTGSGGGYAEGGNGGKGYDGASGGGGNYGNSGVAGSGFANQGNDGGAGNTTVSSARAGSGGGGGAGGVGTAAPNQDNGGDGGVGVYANILTTTQATAASVGEVSGSNVYFGGGGGGSIGSNSTGSPGDGGLGGGGDGNGSGTVAAGTANTGGGGGSGGSGVVIIKFPDTYTMGGGTGLTIHTPSSPPSGFTLKVFTAGTGTISFS